MLVETGASSNSASMGRIERLGQPFQIGLHAIDPDGVGLT
jgi:hypothetical protein